MTTNQRFIIQQLFCGCFITHHNGRYRLIDEKRNPVLAFTKKTMKNIQPLLRKRKDMAYVIDLRAVRASHGKSWVKQYYKTGKKLGFNQPF